MTVPQLAGRFSIAALILALAACAGMPTKPSNVRVTLAASADVNPDANGRPSPIVVRIYQLKADAAFQSAEFFALYDNEQQALAADFISRDEFVLAPGASQQTQLAVSPAARFVGIVAAYRDVRAAEWRVVVPVPIRNNSTISVERARVQVTRR